MPAKTLQHYSAMECKTREDPTLHLHFQKLFFSLAYPVLCRFLHSYLCYSEQSSLLSFLILVVYIVMSHKLKGFAIWLVSLCSTVKYTTLPPPLLVVPSVSASTAMSKHQFKLSGVFALQARGVILSCQTAMNPPPNHTICISWLFANVSFIHVYPLSSFSSFW